MTQQEYCTRLEAALQAMAPEERQETLRYYREFLADAQDAERDALGTPEALAQKILQENGIAAPSPVPVPSPSPSAAPAASPRKASGGDTALKIILLLVTCPIWLSLLVTVLAVVLSLLVCLLVIPICLMVALVAAVAYAVFSAWKDIPYALFLAGMGLICGGGALLLWRPIWLLIRSICKGAGICIKKLFRTVF